MVAASFLSSASWAAGSVCEFRALGGLALEFGTLDPSINQPAQATLATNNLSNMAGNCNGPGNMTISIVGSTSRQLVSGANTINYTITGLPISIPKPGNAPSGNEPPGNPDKGYITWFIPSQIVGIIPWNAFADAPAGVYSDSVTIDISP